MIPGWPAVERAEHIRRSWQTRSLDGRFSGTVIVLNVDHENLRRTLPPGLSTDAGLHGKRHPLLLMVGTQRAVHPVVFGYRLQFSAMREYREACVVVPDLVPAGSPANASAAWRTYFARLYLDRIAPTLYGRWPYGWNKCLARFTEDQHCVRIERRRKGLLLELKTSRPTDVGHRPDFAAFDRIAAHLARPAIVGQKRVDRPSRLTFRWSEADIEPVEAELAIGPRLLIGLDAQHRTTGDADENGCHACQICVDWSLETSPSEPESAADSTSEPLLRPVRNSA